MLLPIDAACHTERDGARLRIVLGDGAVMEYLTETSTDTHPSREQKMRDLAMFADTLVQPAEIDAILRRPEYARLLRFAYERNPARDCTLEWFLHGHTQVYQRIVQQLYGSAKYVDARAVEVWLATLVE